MTRALWRERVVQEAQEILARGGGADHVSERDMITAARWERPEDISEHVVQASRSLVGYPRNALHRANIWCERASEGGPPVPAEVQAGRLRLEAAYRAVTRAIVEDEGFDNARAQMYAAEIDLARSMREANLCLGSDAPWPE